MELEENTPLEKRKTHRLYKSPSLGVQKLRFREVTEKNMETYQSFFIPGFSLGDLLIPLDFSKDQPRPLKPKKEKTQMFTVKTTPLSPTPLKKHPRVSNEQIIRPRRLVRYHQISLMLKWYQQFVAKTAAFWFVSCPLKLEKNKTPKTNYF